MLAKGNPKIFGVNGNKSGASGGLVHLGVNPSSPVPVKRSKIEAGRRMIAAILDIMSGAMHRGFDLQERELRNQRKEIED